MSDFENKPLIAGRVLLIGEKALPGDIVGQLTDRHMQIFLREPDPSLWPPEMRPLIEFLPYEEQLQVRVRSACAEQENSLDQFLARWTLLIWKEVTLKGGARLPKADVVIDEMARYLKERLTKYLADDLSTRPDKSTGGAQAEEA